MMNEKIKELAEQAERQVRVTVKSDMGYMGFEIDEGEFRRVFAELIVRECAELIDNKEMITALQTYDEVFVAKYDTKEQCSKQILEHFGVEL